jgi:hypothetical protein
VSTEPYQLLFEFSSPATIHYPRQRRNTANSHRQRVSRTPTSLQLFHYCVLSILITPSTIFVVMSCPLLIGLLLFHGQQLLLSWQVRVGHNERDSPLQRCMSVIGDFHCYTGINVVALDVKVGMIFRWIDVRGCITTFPAQA